MPEIHHEPKSEISGGGQAIDIFAFFTLSSHNFFPERDTDSDICIHHFSKSVPRIIISPQISFWTAHTRHSPPLKYQNTENYNKNYRANVSQNWWGMEMNDISGNIRLGMYMCNVSSDIK